MAERGTAGSRLQRQFRDQLRGSPPPKPVAPTGIFSSTTYKTDSIGLLSGVRFEPLMPRMRVQVDSGYLRTWAEVRIGRRLFSPRTDRRRSDRRYTSRGVYALPQGVTLFGGPMMNGVTFGPDSSVELRAVIKINGPWSRLARKRFGRNLLRELRAQGSAAARTVRRRRRIDARAWRVKRVPTRFPMVAGTRILGVEAAVTLTVGGKVIHLDPDLNPHLFRLTNLVTASRTKWIWSGWPGQPRDIIAATRDHQLDDMARKLREDFPPPDLDGVVVIEESPPFLHRDLKPDNED